MSRDLRSELAEVDFSCTCQVCAPLEEGAVAPAPPLPVFPYVIVKVEPPGERQEETVIVWLATETGAGAGGRVPAARARRATVRSSPRARPA